MVFAELGMGKLRGMRVECCEGLKVNGKLKKEEHILKGVK